jgi:hypothetical protein
MKKITFTKRNVPIAPLIAAGCVFLLAGCGDDMACESSSVQNTAKQLLLLQLDDWSSPPEEQFRHYRGTSHLDSTFNTIRSRGKNTSLVSFNAVETLRTPDDEEKQETSPEVQRLQKMWKKKDRDMQTSTPFYTCAATAEVQLSPKVAERVEKLKPELQVLMGYENQKLNLGIVYTTSKTSSGDKEVSIGFQNLMMGVLLGSALRPESEKPSAGTNENTDGVKDK